MLRLYYALIKLEYFNEEIWDTLLTGIMTKRGIRDVKVITKLYESLIELE